MGEPGPLGRLAVSLGRVARGGRSRPAGILEPLHRLVSAICDGALGLRQVLSQALLQARRRFTPHQQSLTGTLQAVEGAESGLSATGRVGQLVLGPAALLEQRGQLLLGAAARDRDGVATRFRIGTAFGHRREIELRDPRPERGDLDRELLGALGRRCLESQRPQPLSHFLLDVLGPLDLRRDTRELELGAMLAALELAEAGGFLDEVAPVLRLRGEHGIDLALGHDRVHRAAEAHIGEQLDEVGAADGRLVDEVLAFAAAHETAGDRDLVVVDLLAEAAVLVVEDELDLAVVGGRRESTSRRRGRRRASRRGARTVSASLPPRRSRRRRSTCRSRSARRRRRRPARASARAGRRTT